MNKMSLTISLTALLSLAGCVEDDVATCTGPGLPGICIEYTESSAAAREMCAIGVNDRFEPGNVCPGEARLGGCRVVHSNSEGVIEETTWFYPGATRDTEEEIRSFCDLFVGEYLPPS